MNQYSTERLGDQVMIKHVNSGYSYYAGADINVADNIVVKLNRSHRPNIEINDNNLYICYNQHDKGEKCQYECEIQNCNIQYNKHDKSTIL